MNEQTALAQPPVLRASPELTIVVPTFNERDNIRPLLDLIAKAMAGDSYEVVFVDDDSRDGTLGEFASEARPLFTIADLSTLWIDLAVYRRDFGKVRVGDPVELWGPDNPVESVARAAGTIAYELTCRVSSRVPRSPG